MGDLSSADKKRLKEPRLRIYEALSEFADLHVWPTDKDVAQLEAELLQELDKIES